MKWTISAISLISNGWVFIGNYKGKYSITIFFSFSADDCFWDFAQCTHKSSLPCCQNRFDKCCKIIMPQSMAIPQNPPQTPPTTIKTTTPPPCQHRSVVNHELKAL